MMKSLNYYFLMHRFALKEKQEVNNHLMVFSSDIIHIAAQI
jgi:hypothetical protein